MHPDYHQSTSNNLSLDNYIDVSKKTNQSLFISNSQFQTQFQIITPSTSSNLMKITQMLKTS